MNTQAIFNRAMTRLKSGTQLDDLTDEELRVLVLSQTVVGIVRLAERFKTRPLDIVDYVEDAIVELQEAGKIKPTYGKKVDDDDPWF